MSEIYTVVVDPGHGGKDSGAVGPNGLKESDVVLDIARRVVDELTKLGIRVVMTRQEDVFMTLAERCRIANDAEADRFISIHANSAETPAKGIETFVSPSAPTTFGDHIQAALMERFPGHVNRGLKRAGFYVLNGTRMSAALTEVEFIHTQAGEDFLRDPVNRIHLAGAIAVGVVCDLGMGMMKPAPVHDEPVPKPAISLREELARVISELQTLAGKL